MKIKWRKSDRKIKNYLYSKKVIRCVWLCVLVVGCVVVVEFIKKSENFYLIGKGK